MHSRSDEYPIRLAIVLRAALLGKRRTAYFSRKKEKSASRRTARLFPSSAMTHANAHAEAPVFFALASAGW
jgi:hypothetical protein